VGRDARAGPRQPSCRRPKVPEAEDGMQARDAEIGRVSVGHAPALGPRPRLSTPADWAATAALRSADDRASRRDLARRVDKPARWLRIVSARPPAIAA